jgi:two-component system cell cycle sensor histidine kinase/response regulator CckA
MTKLNEAADPNRPVVENAQRPGTVTRLVLLALVLIATAAAFVWFRDQLENEIVLGILGVLAMAGIFFLVSAFIGFVEVMPQNRMDILSHAVLNSQPDGIVITDRKGSIVYANAAYGRLAGADAATGAISIEHLLSKSRESTEAVYRLTNGLMEGKAGAEEFRLPRPLGQSDSQGSAWWYRLKARPQIVEEERGGPFFIWQISDITAERGEQEEFFRELQNAIDYLDHAPAGFFSAGRKGEIFYVNATLADWLGIDLTKFESGSMMIRDICAGEGLTRLETIHPEPGHIRTETLDVDFRKVNGQSLPVRIVHRVSATKDGAPGESRTIVLQRNATEEAGRDEDSSAAMRFNRFFNNTPMAIASVDGEGRILRTNTQFMKLFSPLTSREEGGNSLFSIVPESDREHLNAALAAAKDRKVDIEPVDSRHPVEEGRYFRFYVNAVIDQSDEAPEEAAIVYAVETTQQKALENQMAQTQKMNAVGTLAGGIAHDFNNVLTAILLSSDHLLLQARQSDSSFADLMEIKRNANRAAVLVRQLLAFSRKQTLRPAVINLTDAIGDLRMLVTRMLSGTKVKLEIEYGRDLWPVKTDLSQFEQVMVNLSVNARDAMPEGGILTIRTHNMPAAETGKLNFRGLPAEDFVVIDVADTGTGIPPEIMDKIFEPFFTTKEVGKGTGLGLSMVYGIIKQSGGYVLPVSEVGKGTMFHIFLPRHIPQEVPVVDGVTAEASASAAEVKAAAPAEDVDLTGNSAVVLLVEDEDAVRRGGKRMLETRGYTVHEAGSGVEALEILEELDGKVDVVVSDVVMPEMDGPTLLGEIRKLYPDMKFIFVSGFAEDAFARNLPEGSKFGFLPKPFSLKQLATTVREMLDS